MYSKNKNHTNKPASFVKLSSSISVKFLKKAQKILKFFKKNSQPMKRKDNKKSYTQASLMYLLTNTSKFLKIKENFQKLQAKKIENIQKIINSKDKLKPKINMMTKGPSRKQIIISISNENKLRFIESSSDYIANINKALKNIKFKVMANFIQVDKASIIIMTNKVVSQLNFQMIKKYVKNIGNINTNKVEVSRLP